MTLLLSLPCVLSVVVVAFFRFPIALAWYFGTAAFADAHVAGGTLAGVLAVWVFRDVVHLEVARWQRAFITTAVGFLLLAFAQSSLVTNDIGRLATEAIQWTLGVGLAISFVLGVHAEDRHRVQLALMWGAFALCIGRLLLLVSDRELGESSSLLSLSQANYSSLYILFGAVVVPLALGDRLGRWHALAIVGTGLSVIMLNESRASLATGAAVILVFLWRAAAGNRFAFAALATSLIIGSATLASMLAGDLITLIYDPGSVLSLANFENNFSNLERIGLLFHSYDVFVTNPFGLGIGASVKVFETNPFTILSYPHPHNTLAMLVVELGVLGLTGYLVFFAMSVRMIWRGALSDSSAPAAIIATGLVSASVLEAMLFNGMLAMLFWLMFALAYSSSEAHGDEVRSVVLVTGLRPIDVVRG